ncbi:MAG TPA: phosphopentomutase [Firmicutes bacterium]|nr:phosphopentomutase [Bacillota bacterium]
MKRVFLIVLDGVGIGELPDAAAYGDEGSNSLVNTAKAVNGLALPVMESLGLGKIITIPGVEPVKQATGAYGKMAEASPGKDTITGHWEMSGIILDRPFPVYPQGFPREVLADFEQRIGCRVLGNIAASGTEIIKKLGAEHMRTGYPIVYTSADSVFQIAAHEEVILPEELYRYCRIARELLQGEHNVARVIARPFLGVPGSFARTSRRKDFSLAPPEETILDRLAQKRVRTIGVGKIDDIFSHRGLAESYHTVNNQETMGKTLELAKEPAQTEVFAFINCIDFDMVYGHRNDVAGYARALEEADAFLGQLLSSLSAEDVVIVTGDHGCDPTTPSTDHSREYVPLLVAGAQVRQEVNLGIRKTFADVSATVAEIFGITGWTRGSSFYKEIL